MSTATAADATIAISANRAFIPGVLTLLYSLRHHNPEIPPVVVFSADLKPGDIPGAEIRPVSVSDYDGCADHPRWKESWYKLEVFRMPERGPVVMLGGDQLCLGNVSELWRPTDSLLRTTRTFGNNILKHGGVCSDCLVVHESLRSEATWKRLVGFGRRRLNGGWADQGAVDRLAFEDRIDIDFLPDKYSMMKRQYRHREIDPADDVRLLHYVGSRKPWDAGLPKTGLEKSGGEEGYDLVESVWREYHKRAIHDRHVP